MIRYIVKRSITGLILLFFYASMLFFAVQVILPGDYVSQFTLGLTPSQAEELRQALGLEMPIWQRYLKWITDLLHGNLGLAYTAFGLGSPVVDIVKATLPITLFIFGIGTALAFMIGQWLGKVAAWRGPGLFSSSATFVSIALYTSFPPWLAFLAIHFFAFRLGMPISLQNRPYFHTPGLSQASIVTQMLVELVVVWIVLLALNAAVRRVRRKGLPGLVFFVLVVAGWVAGWYVIGIQEAAVEIIRMSAVPTILYTLLAFGEVMLIMRTSMIDTLNEDYIQTAYAKGLPGRVVRDEHAARNALLPVLSRLVISLPFLLSGMVMIEDVLSIDGIGTTLFYAVGMQNITLALGLTLVIGVISLITRLVLDVLQAALDPRIHVRT